MTLGATPTDAYAGSDEVAVQVVETCVAGAHLVEDHITQASNSKRSYVADRRP